MGVDGLYKFINKNFPDIFNNISINDIKGKSCIIDGMQHIYGQLIYMRSREKEIITENGKNISHIHGLINSLTYYLKHGIVPIFIFDGKTPEIKKKKIEERKKNLKENLTKLKDLEEKKNTLNNYINLLSGSPSYLEGEYVLGNESNKDDDLIYGTPPIDTFNLEDEINKMNNIQEEYKKIYKKSIVMKDYYIKDWIEILELLGLPVIKATGEADPLCAYLLKSNPNIYGIISDDSDMLVFGAPILMRKSINQQFTIIELKLLLEKIQILLLKELGYQISFDIYNLVDFSIMLGTDYGTIKTNEIFSNSLELLKYYVINEKDYKKVISPEQYENFENIKKYYTVQEFDNLNFDINKKPNWNKPKLMELKKRLLELFVDEDYIDKNNEFLDLCYNRIKKGKIIFKNNFIGFTRFRSNSFDDKKSYISNKNYNFEFSGFKRLFKNPTFHGENVQNKTSYLEDKVSLLLTDNVNSLTKIDINNEKKLNNDINNDINNKFINETASESNSSSNSTISEEDNIFIKRDSDIESLENDFFIENI